MARQKFGVKIIGTLDDINFQRTGGKDIVKLKGGVEKDRIMKDEKFVRTRENMAEFGAAGNESKWLVDALAPLIGQAYDRYYFSRLLGKMKANLNTDTTNARGERAIQYAAFGSLVNFAFNTKAKLATVLRSPYTLTRSTTSAAVAFTQGINPKWDIKSPTNSTRYQLGLIIAGKVPGEDRYDRAVFMSGIFPLDTPITAGAPDANLVATLSGSSYDAIVVAMGIFFGQEVNGGDYAFHNKQFNALDIIYAGQP